MKKRIISLLMAVMMLVALVVPASATTDTSGTVTVYVTYGMFTEGGYDTAAKASKDQEYNSTGLPTSDNINGNFSNINGVEYSIEDIAAYSEGFRYVYGAPEDFTNYPNVVDAILTAFDMEYPNLTADIVCGWDSYTTPNGGYINSIPNGGEPVYNATTTTTLDGVNYNVYSGYGWNIAIGTSSSNISSIEHYGTEYTLTDGMIIVFDYSAYELYYAA